MTDNTLPLFTPDETVPVAAQHQITATQVTDENHISFWPQHFGSIPQWITLEPTVFAWMDLFCTDYSGGIWNFYTLSNGGAFMAPEADNSELWTLFNTLNGNGGELSAEAAGIAVCLMTYSHHAMRTECDAMTGALLPPAGLCAQSRRMQRHHAHHRLSVPPCRMNCLT